MDARTDDHPTGLGTARALKKSGFEIWGLAHDLLATCFESKTWHKIIKVSKAGKNFLNEMLELGTQQKSKPVFLPSQDDVVKIFSDHRGMLQEYFLFNLPDSQVVYLLLNKTTFYPWALEHVLPVPESYIVRSLEELSLAVSQINSPFLIKPLVRTRSWKEASPDDKVILIKNKEDFNHIKIDYFDLVFEYLAQKWTPGRDSDVYFCLEYYDRNDQEVDYFVGKKILQ